MSLKIRLARAGTKKRPYYHVVIADSRALAGRLLTSETLDVRAEPELGSLLIDVLDVLDSVSAAELATR